MTEKVAWSGEVDKASSLRHTDGMTIRLIGAVITLGFFVARLAAGVPLMLNLMFTLLLLVGLDLMVFRPIS